MAEQNINRPEQQTEKPNAGDSAIAEQGADLSRTGANADYNAMQARAGSTADAHLPQGFGLDGLGNPEEQPKPSNVVGDNSDRTSGDHPQTVDGEPVKKPPEGTTKNSDGTSTTIKYDDNGGWTNTQNGADGKPTEATNFGADGKSTETTKFGADGKPTETTKFGADGRATEATKFGADGKPTERTSFGADGHTPTEISKFGADGKPTETTKFAADGHTPTETTRFSGDGKQTTVAFDNNGNPTSVTSRENWNGYIRSTQLPEGSKNFKWDENGQPTYETQENVTVTLGDDLKPVKYRSKDFTIERHPEDANNGGDPNQWYFHQDGSPTWVSVSDPVTNANGSITVTETRAFPAVDAFHILNKDGAYSWHMP